MTSSTLWVYPETMAQYSTTQLAFPDFRGAARRLVLLNLAAFFLLQIAAFSRSDLLGKIVGGAFFSPVNFLHGAWWQPLTYSFVHPTIFGTFFELLSLWFLVSFLEMERTSEWATGLYASSVLGTAAAALLLHLLGVPGSITFNGCFGGIFGLLIAIGVLFGDREFRLFFVIAIKARYLAAIYALLTLAMLFSEQKIFAFAQLGGAIAGLAFIWLAPRQGLSFSLSESWYALRNRYYRSKRRRAAKRFEVYMNRQGRTVRFDGQGKYIDDDQDDKKRWN
jgi:membrane associated rhomboid family serine protease